MKVNTKVTVPPVTRYNYKTKTYDVMVPEFDAELLIAVDIEKIAATMGVKAAKNGRYKSIDAGGALVVYCRTKRPAAVASATDEHRPGFAQVAA